MKPHVYVLFAADNPDESCILASADSLREIRRDAKDQGGGFVYSYRLQPTGRFEHGKHIQETVPDSETFEGYFDSEGRRSK
ncbi:MAG: hypothetical protein HY791_03035 [Deltaproteobacteria bacterium]|nr:hypothetical protein [Deltaproteobacteria bacterium]